MVILLELVGMVLVAAAAFVLAIPLGLLVSGVLLVCLAEALDRRPKRKKGAEG